MTLARISKPSLKTVAKAGFFAVVLALIFGSYAYTFNRFKALREEVARRTLPPRPIAKAPNETAAPVSGKARESDQEDVLLAAFAERQFVPLWGFVDAIGLYSKNGRVENFGANIRQRRQGPIAVGEMELQRTADDAYLFWHPDFSPAGGARFLEVSFKDTLPRRGRLTVGLVLADGEVISFQRQFGPLVSSSKGSVRDKLPDDLAKAVAGATRGRNLAELGTRLVAALPASLVVKLANPKDGDKLIRTWFVSIEGLDDEVLRISSLSLAGLAGERSADLPLSLAGQVRGVSPRPGQSVELVTESGKHITQQIAVDGSFKFDGLAPGRPVSIRFRHAAQDYYATAGRWFAPHADQRNVVVDLAPRFVNPTGREPDPKAAKFQSTGSTEITEEYQPHTRQVWPGYGGHPQEYDSTTFANNIGHIDRDRLFDNSDKCYRILAFGSSLSVAIQVPVFEKFNIVLEEELGVALQRCVEVIHLGRNNGDIGAVYPRLRKYGPQFKQDLVLLENSAGVMFQLQPELVRKLLGYDFDKSPLDHFTYDKGGNLQFVPLATDWAIFSAEPSTTPIQGNVPFLQIFSVPFDVMAPEAKAGYQMVRDIYRYYERQFPESRFAVFNALEQANCRGNCQSQAKLDNGNSVTIGTPVFLRNMRSYCAANKMRCYIPPLPTNFGNKPETYLTWTRDAHLSPRGHQWLARELARLIHADLKEPATR